MTMKNSVFFPHESARRHVTGEARYVNDLPESASALTGKVVYSPHASARILFFDLEEAKKTPGVQAVLSCRDIPGHNQLGAIVHDEPCLAEDTVKCIGQAIFLIAADSEKAASEAERKIIIEYEELDAVLDIGKAIACNHLISPPKFIIRGDADQALARSPFTLSGELKTGAQEHWYLETQSCLAVPGEGGEMTLYSSTQNPTEVQTMVAEVLGIQRKHVICEARRLGGGFGGKETQAHHVAAWSALLAKTTGKAVKIHLFRDDDQIITGKRHRFLSNYKIGFDQEGKILAYKVELNSDAGCGTDLSNAILERAMLHAENSYFIPDISITGKAYYTNLPSNTAFRGFGGPQGMAVIENAIDRVARFLKKDAAEIRKLNFYSDKDHNRTPYDMMVRNNHLHRMYGDLMQNSRYQERRKEINRFNEDHKYIKRGMALTPVKFGISFTTTFLNQAGALVNIYTDGSVQVSHGGTEMGQGLYTKILQIATRELGISSENIQVIATNTSRVPNTSPTAASSGTDMNGMAVKNAIDVLKSRLAEVAAGELGKVKHGEPTQKEDIRFGDNIITDIKHPDRSISFRDLISTAYLKRISLSSTGYYSTPEIWFDRATGKGMPFYYFAYGMSVSEVEADMLTGDCRILSSEILHDAGDSINTEIDLGQIAGGFLQGVGWCTCEEIKWDQRGRLLTSSPDTYKIPTINDIPEKFTIRLLDNAGQEGTIHHSKAVGEPPFMLAFSVWLAIKDAISAYGKHESEPDFAIPATNELIVLSANQLKQHR